MTVSSAGERPHHVAFSLASRLAPVIASRRGAAVCFVVALGAFAVDSAAWPLYLGRDAATYLDYWVDMWHAHPVYPELMLFRTPLAPLAWGIPLQIGGAVLAEIAAGLAFAVSVVAFAAAGSQFSTGTGVLTACALLVFPSYGSLFEGVSSDAVFAFVLSLWTLGLVRASRDPRPWRFGALGIGVGVLVLARPEALMLVPVAVFPLVLPLVWRRRVAGASVFVAAVVISLVAWAGYNDLRYGDFVISRTTNAHFPLYRLFVEDRLVRPNNGPASRKLAAAVKRDLLTKQPYKAYGITLNEFFSSGSTRMWGDLVALSDREWGWSSDYSLLRSVAIEAIRKHPRRYARGVATTIEQELSLPFIQPRSVVAAPAPPPSLSPTETIVVDGRRLPKPSEGEPIPASAVWWLASTPDGHIRTDFSSFANPRFVFATPVQAARSERLTSRVDALVADLPNRNGSASIQRLLARWTRVYPPDWIWIVVGLIALVVRRPRGSRVLAVLLLIGLGVVVGSALGEPAVLQYRVPVDPLFFLFTSGALFGVGRRGERRRLYWRA